MKQRKKEMKGESEILRLTNRLDDLIGKLAPSCPIDPLAPPRTPAPTPPEPRYSERPLFAFGLPEIPEEQYLQAKCCVALGTQTAKDIHTFATFGRVSSDWWQRERPPAVMFTITTCPLVQHLCGGRAESCPLKVAGKYMFVAWKAQQNGFTLPLN